MTLLVCLRGTFGHIVNQLECTLVLEMLNMNPPNMYPIVPRPCPPSRASMPRPITIYITKFTQKERRERERERESIFHLHVPEGYGRALGEKTLYFLCHLLSLT
jgi:hypothetical protein